MVKVSVAKIDQAKLKRIIAKKQKLIRNNIKAVLRNEAVPFLINQLVEGLESLADRADQGPDDPTNPANWTEEFRAKLEEDLANTFLVTGSRISIKIGEKKFLGYDAAGRNDPDDDSPLVWLVYYIEGLAGEWGFITRDVYESFRGPGTYQLQWGRFSAGFMISREDFIAEGWNKVIAFDSIRHPFSGFSPVDIFTEALNEFKIRPFLQKAIKAATEGRKL